jgi:hypothetical protein
MIVGYSHNGFKNEVLGIIHQLQMEGLRQMHPPRVIFKLYMQVLIKSKMEQVSKKQEDSFQDG